MKFQIEVKEKRGGEAWWETFDEEACTDEASIKRWAEGTIAAFNATLRPGEKPRVFAGGVKVVGAGTRRHLWTKRNLVSLSDHRGTFDNVECTACKARARRYGFDRIKMQKGYTAKKWTSCPGKPSSGDERGIK